MERRQQGVVILILVFMVVLIAVGSRSVPPQGIASQVAAVRGAVVHVSKEGPNGPICQGSGCLISPDGILFSAKHVTDGDPNATYTVTTDDDTQYKVKYVLEDRENDVSFMKLDLPPGVGSLPYAQLVQEDTMRVGDAVFIFGSPLGKDNVNTVSLGIISALNRDLYNRQGWEEARPYQWRAMIQTTSPAFPGNSGGPLFNARGEVVGVLVAGQDPCLNFAVPVVFLRDSVDAVRQWFTLCRIRPLVPDMRGPRGLQGEPGPQGPAVPDPNTGGVK